jgi:hypothetical protein
MSNKKHYYENVHFFGHHCSHYHAVLRMLSLIAEATEQTQVKTITAHVRTGIPHPRFFYSVNKNVHG